MTANKQASNPPPKKGGIETASDWKQKTDLEETCFHGEWSQQFRRFPRTCSLFCRVRRWRYGSHAAQLPIQQRAPLHGPSIPPESCRSSSVSFRVGWRAGWTVRKTDIPIRVTFDIICPRNLILRKKKAESLCKFNSISFYRNLNFVIWIRNDSLFVWQLWAK